MRILISMGLLAFALQTSSSATPQHGNMMVGHVCGLTPSDGLVGRLRANQGSSINLISALDSSWQDNGVILGSDQAKSLLHQCSRAAPEKVTGQWTPSSQQIAQLEVKLPEFKRSLKRPAAQLLSFYRQYAGFVAGGRKIVYVNFFPKDIDPQWRTRAVGVCDGGESFWGVEFEVDTGKFVNAAFNGFA
jgi:hypothetical protein